MATLTKFLIEAHVFSEDGTSLDVSNSLVAVNVKKDFIGNCFPLYVCEFKANKETILKLAKKNTRLAINVSTYEQTDQTIDQTNSTPFATGFLTPVTIALYDQAPFDTTFTTEDGISEDEIAANQLFDYQVMGAPADLIPYNSKVVNMVYNDVTINDVHINLLSSLNIDNLYIESANNKTVYRSLFIPAMNLIPAMNYIADTYEVYDRMYSLFFDVDRTYLYDPAADRDNFDNELLYKVVPLNQTANSSQSNDIIIDGKNITITKNDPPAIKKMDDIISDSQGSNMVFNSYDDNFNINRREYSNDNKFDKTRYFWNTTGSLVSERNIVNVTKTQSAIMLVDVNPELITPITRVRMETGFDNSSGDYFIGSLAYSLSTTDFVTYTTVANVTVFKK